MADIKSLNRVILMGTVGRVYEGKKTRNNNYQVSLSLVTNEKYRDGKERADWHTVYFYGKGAEFIKEKVGPGTLILIEGKLRHLTWTDKEGDKKSSVRVEATTFTIVIWKNPPAEEGAEEEPGEEEGGTFGDVETEEPKTEGEEEIPF